MDHLASFIIHYYSLLPYEEPRIHITKNRHNTPIGDVDVDEFLDVVLSIVAEKCYKGYATVFQEALMVDLKKAVNEVLVKHLIKAVKENDGITI